MNKKPFLQRLKTSFDGLLHAAKTETNMRIHLAVGVVVVSAGILFQIDRYEWLAIAICIGSVLAAECFNTAVERLADRVQSEMDPLIGQAKDCAAGAVLCVSITSSIVGVVVFVPKVMAIW